MRNLMQTALESTSAFAALAVACHLLAPLAPAVTLLSVLIGLLFALDGSRLRAIMAFGGLLLFVASWPAVNVYGQLAAMSIWSMGVLLFFIGATGFGSTGIMAPQPKKIA